MKTRHIHIIDDMLRDLVVKHYASVEDICDTLGCSRRTGWRILRAHRVALVHDPKRPRAYTVMRRDTLDNLKITLRYVPRDGNPGWALSSVQRDNALKRWRKRTNVRIPNDQKEPRA